MLRCNLPPALLAENPVPFICHCSKLEVEQTPSKSQHTRLTPEQKIFLPGFLNWQPFSHESSNLPTSYQGFPILYDVEYNTVRHTLLSCMMMHEYGNEGQTAIRVCEEKIRRMPRCIKHEWCRKHIFLTLYI